MQRFLVLLVPIVSALLAGCGGGGGPGKPPFQPAMSSPSYRCETLVLSRGGGTASSADYTCIGTITTPTGASMSLGYNCQAGFQNATNARRGF